MTSDKDSGGNFCESELIPCEGSNDVMNQNSKNKSREEHRCLLTKNISNLDGQGQKKKTTEEQISTTVFGFLLKLPENKKKHEEQDKDQTKPNDG